MNGFPAPQAAKGNHKTLLALYNLSISPSTAASPPTTTSGRARWNWRASTRVAWSSDRAGAPQAEITGIAQPVFPRRPPTPRGCDAGCANSRPSRSWCSLLMRPKSSAVGATAWFGWSRAESRPRARWTRSSNNTPGRSDWPGVHPQGFPEAANPCQGGFPACFALLDYRGPRVNPSTSNSIDTFLIPNRYISGPTIAF